MRATVRAVAEACDAPIDCEDDLVQAVDEAVTNVILHGYRGAAGWVEISAERDDGRHRHHDRGHGADVRPDCPCRHPTWTIPLERRRPGGMGVHLMRLRHPTRSSIDRGPAAAIS